MSKNFIGVLYNNVIRSEGQRDCIVSAKDVILGEKGYLHLKEGMRLATDDIQLESVKGLPLYIEHKYELGQVGTIQDAFYSDNKDLGNQHYNAGIHFNQNKEADGLQLCIRGEVSSDKIQYVLNTIGIADLSEAALSIGYRYSYQIHEMNASGQALSYKIVGKQVYEGSLCKYGRIANSGVLMTLAESNSLTTEHFGEGSYRIKLQEQQKQINDINNMSSEPTTNAADQATPPPLQQEEKAIEENNVRAAAPQIDAQTGEKMLKEAMTLGVDVTQSNWMLEYMMKLSDDRQQRINAHRDQWRPVIDRSMNSLKECVKLSQTYTFTDPEMDKIQAGMLIEDGQLNARAYAAFTERIAEQDKELAELKNSVESLQSNQSKKRTASESEETDQETSTNSKRMRIDEPQKDLTNRYNLKTKNDSSSLRDKLQNSLFFGQQTNSFGFTGVANIADQLSSMEREFQKHKTVDDKRVRNPNYF
jgi:hypothetical protein